MHSLQILPSAVRDLDALDPTVLRRLRPKLERLREDPRPHGCIKLTADGGYRIRVGDYRILYRVADSARVVFVYRIKHRREAYR